MTPKTDDILLNNIEEVTEQTSKTYCLNIEKIQFQIFAMALKQ